MECDGFEITRDGVDEVNAKIIFYINHQPQKFKLARSLSKVLGIHTATKVTHSHDGSRDGILHLINALILLGCCDRTPLGLHQGFASFDGDPISIVPILFRLYKNFICTLSPI